MLFRSARRCDRKFAVAVNSGTTGLILTLQSLLPPDSNVLIPALSYVATLNSVIYSQCHPRFCDTDHNGLIDLETLDYVFNGEISAIMYANLWGHCVDYDRFAVISDFFNHDVFTIEDAAQSFGARYHGRPSGSLGYASVLSFDPTKNLNNYGSGGMILTDSPLLFEDLQNLRSNGRPGDFHQMGTNVKMSESDCAQLLIKLKYFDRWQTRRTQIAEYYTERLSAYVDVVLPDPGVTSAWSKFVVKCSERHALQAALNRSGIETRITYNKTLPEYPIAGFGPWSEYREAIAFTRECLSLPIYPELADYEVEMICDVIEQYLS